MSLIHHTACINVGENVIQEYGEVVCVMGSSANYSNIEVFLQANASMAIEPRYPQLCQSVPVSLPPKVGPSPVAASQLLNSVASSLSFKVRQFIKLQNCHYFRWCCYYPITFIISQGIYFRLC